MSATLNRAYSHPRLPKAAFIAELQAHAAADRIVQGRYWTGRASDGRGCAVGCSINSASRVLGQPARRHNDHAAYERLLGIPRLLARLEDRIFEGLPPDEARAWPLRFSTAIAESADLSGVWDRFAPWLLREIALPSVAEKHTRQRAAIIAVAEGFETGWTTQTPRAASRAAADAYAACAAPVGDAADDAAYAAAAACAAPAVVAADDAPAYAAYAAARRAADAAYADAAAAADAVDVRDAARTSALHHTYSRMADKLCELLAAAPVPEVGAQVQPAGEG